MPMRILGVIPARGGSKGVPRKNIREIGGHPLIAYTLRAAQASTRLTRCIVSTEDAEIAEVAGRYGGDVPFVRPAELAADGSGSIGVVQHAVAALEDAGEVYDAVCLLQPTHPLRTGADIDAAVERFGSRPQASALVTVVPVPHEFNPHWTFLEDGGYLRIATGDEELFKRRQDLPSAYVRDGAIYLTRRDTLMRGGSLYGDRLTYLEMPAERHVNIDTLEDWRDAERLLLSHPRSV